MANFYTCRESTLTWDCPPHWDGTPATLAVVMMDGIADVPCPAAPLHLEACTAAFVPLPLADTIAMHAATALLWVIPPPAISLPVGTRISLDETSAAVAYDVFFAHTRPEPLQSAALEFIYHQLSALSASPEGNGEQPTLVERVVAYLQGHLEETITLGSLAEEFECSKSALNRRFLSERGETPIRALAGLRIAHSRRLLQNTDQTVSQIAHATGYHDLAAFSHFFKQHTGQSPSEFRDNCQWLV